MLSRPQLRNVGVNPTIENAYHACFSPELFDRYSRDGFFDPLEDALIDREAVLINQRGFPESSKLLTPSEIDDVIREKRVRLGLQTYQDVFTPSDELRTRFHKVRSGLIVGWEALARAELANTRGRFGQVIGAGTLLVNASLDQKREIERQVMIQAAMFHSFLHRHFGQRIPFSVNVSEGSLKDPGFVEFMKSVKKEYGIKKGYVKLELLERLPILNDRDIDVLFDLEELGFEIVIDDYCKPKNSCEVNNSIPNFDILTGADFPIYQVKFPGSDIDDMDLVGGLPSDDLLARIRRVRTRNVNQLVFEGSRKGVSLKHVEILKSMEGEQSLSPTRGLVSYLLEGTVLKEPFDTGEIATYEF